MTHSLTLGSLLLTDSFPDDEHGYKFNVGAEGTSFGVAEGVQEIVTSLLADGDLVRTTRFGNRQVTFPVQITGPSLGALNWGEAALRLELGRGNTLTWQAPDVLTVPTVFDVVDSSMEPRFGDLDELRRRRTFNVTLTCSPFARSADLITVPALIPGGAPVTATIDSADAVAGWNAETKSGPVTVTDFGDYIGATTTGFQPSLFVWTAVASAPMTSTPYLRVEVSSDTVSAPTQFGVRMDGGAWLTVTPVLAQAISATITQHYFDLTGMGIALTAFKALRYSSGAPATVFINIHDLSRTNTLTQVSPRQIARVIEVGGTERTPASVHVQSANGSTALGQAIVHTSPEDGSGYSPPLQRWRTVGQTRTADATAFSGTYESINTTSWVAEVPTSALPEGGYVLLARLRAQTAATVTVTWSTSTIFPDATTQEGFTVGTVQHTFATGNVWELVKMDVLSLPSVRTSAGKVQIALQVAAASPVVTLDEAWLFREDDDCGLTIVETARPHLWLDSPGIDSPVPRIWVGNGSTTKVHPGTGLKAMGTHVLSPEGTAVFTAALTDNPATDATFYRRWHSNAAE